jgi:hypothetical protein
LETADLLFFRIIYRSFALSDMACDSASAMRSFSMNSSLFVEYESDSDVLFPMDVSNVFDSAGKPTVGMG